MKTKIIALLALQLWLHSSMLAQVEYITMQSVGFACTDIPSDCLLEVHFSGDIGTNYLPIRLDSEESDDGEIGEVYQAPQFEKIFSLCTPGNLGNIVTQHPVAYVSGTKAQVKAIFQTSRTDPYFLMGVGPEGIEFPSQPIFPSDGKGVYNFKEAKTAFPVDIVRYFEKFTIQWKASNDGASNWANVDVSENTLYVTHKAPIAAIPGIDETGELYKEGIGYEWFEGLFYISCKNANEEKTKVNITTDIWEDFKDNSVSNKVGPLHFYYRWDIPGTYTTTSKLLKYRDGQCYAWCSLFIDLLKIQGIDQENDLLTLQGVPTDLCDASMFLVKDWKFPTEPTQYGELLGTYCSECTHANLGPHFDPNNVDEFWINNDDGVYSYNFYETEVTDEEGVIGQTAPNPDSWFSEHCLVYLDFMGKYYDPSYGTSFTSLEEWKSQSLSGWACLTQQFESIFDVDFNQNGTMKESMTFLGMSPNLGELELNTASFDR